MFKLFNVDSLLEELPPESCADSIDLFVASLAFKNFDFIEKRLPFLIECVTYTPQVWDDLKRIGSGHYWLADEDEGVIIFPQTEHCGCIRTYRYRGSRASCNPRNAVTWTVIRGEQTLYTLLDTITAKTVFNAWYDWNEASNAEATALAEGRLNNTAVENSIIFCSGNACVACGSTAVAYARSTIGLASQPATLVQVPVCTTHLELAKAAPNVLTFLAGLFSLSINLPVLVRQQSLPDELIPMLHDYVAEELGGAAVLPAKRAKRGWILKISLSSGWSWILRINSLTDYAYMLHRPDDKKAVYRADSAPDHPDVPFFPDHEHSRPDRNSDKISSSFLYGTPFFDIKRLRDISVKHGAL